VKRQALTVDERGLLPCFRPRHGRGWPQLEAIRSNTWRASQHIRVGLSRMVTERNEAGSVTPQSYGDPMKIAQVAPLIESVPPTLYGGSERVVSYLTEELVRQGHQITLFASGDSLTSAELVPCTKTALRLTPTVRDPIPYYMLMLDKVRERADEFDILHFHIDQFHFPIFRSMAFRTLTTLHGRQDLPDLQMLYRVFPEMPLVSISNAQRRPCTAANFAATVYHGIPKELHAANLDRRGSYLAFLGRICPEKR